MTKVERAPEAVTQETQKQGRIARYMERNRASDGYLLKRDIGKVFIGLFRLILLFGLCFLILQPLFHQFSASLMGRADLFNPTVISVPTRPSLDNYRMVIYLMDYWWALLRTIGITLLVVTLQIIACTLAGYGFARYDFPLKKLWFAFVILTIIVPPQTMMGPMFLNFRFFDLFGIVTFIRGEPFNLIHRLHGLVILAATGMGLRSGLYIFMLRQYFRNMPKDLEESAYVDGCSKLRTFIQIMLPDAMPMIVSCFLFAFVWQYTDGFYSAMFLRGTGVMSLELSSLGEGYRVWYVLQRAAETNTHGWNPPVGEIQAMVSTGVLIGIAPLIIIYLFAQRMFVESIGQSGLKM